MNNKNYLKYVQAMLLMDEGRSANSVSREMHINPMHIKLIRNRYLRGGERALLSPEYSPRPSAEEKYACIAEVVRKELSLSQASLKYDKPHETLRVWYNAYLRSGMRGLERKNKAMAKKKVYTEEQLDELEILRRRNEYLEAENALLKKVKALVEEREARLRAIGRKPSKD